jgi:peptidoglycan hydrolase-like protein with peptidoglycan-binding domain
MIIPYYGYYDDNAGDYSDGQSSPAEVTPSQETIIAVQKELTQLGYYHGHVDGVIGRQTAQSPPGCENIRQRILKFYDVGAFHARAWHWHL